MTEEIETKWQYISHVYRGRGDTKRADIADEIDKLLSTIPEYSRVTQEWTDDLDAGVVDTMSIDDVTNMIDYCTACEHHRINGRYDCGGCFFAARGGANMFYRIGIEQEG